ncbi:hypothetical protein JHV675_39500 [Mycobacterium avium subsp. hominissuis]
MATTEPHADTRPLLHHSTGRDPIAIDGYTADMLSEHQRTVIARIVGEPDTIAVPPPTPAP